MEMDGNLALLMGGVLGCVMMLEDPNRGPAPCTVKLVTDGEGIVTNMIEIERPSGRYVLRVDPFDKQAQAYYSCSCGCDFISQVLDSPSCPNCGAMDVNQVL